MPHPCPSCQRPNGPHRETCLYCGHKLAVKLDLAEEQGVDEAAIEEAVFAALSGAAAPNPRKSPSGPEAPKAPTPPVQSQKPDPTDLVVSPALEPPPPKREDYAAQLLSEVSVSLAIESSGLPLGRRPFVLVLDGCGDPELAGPLAKLTGLDHVTTRMVATSEWDRPLLWAVERAGLDSLAERICKQFGLKASVQETKRLVDVPAPLGVLGWRNDHLVCTEKAIWMGAQALEEERFEVPFEGIRLAVPGQVEVRRFVEQRRGRWSRNKGTTERREIGERRVVLLDLHSPTYFFRIGLETTNFKGAPEFHEGSGILSLKALVEGLPRHFEGLHVEGKRVAHAQGAKAMQDGESDRSNFEITGWSSWEEHSRLCRLHRGL